jgi:hypothetical protein
VACRAVAAQKEGAEMSDYQYENMRRVCYESGATFVPVCEKCFLIVKARPVIHVNEDTGLKDEPNADCRKCGPTKMLFEGFI